MFNTNEFRKFAVKDQGINGLAVDSYINHIHSIAPNYIVGMTPNVVEERQMRATVIDVFSRLMGDRIIFLGTGIDDYVANVVNAQLLFLESVDSKKDIMMYINSPGGSVYAGCIYYMCRFSSFYGCGIIMRWCSQKTFCPSSLPYHDSPTIGWCSRSGF